jgi:hypothetical protein
MLKNMQHHAAAACTTEGGIHFQIDEGCGEMRFAAVSS